MCDFTIPCCNWSWFSSTIKPVSFLLLLHCPCRVAILMFLCTLGMAIGIVVYCLVRKKVGQGQTPFCVGSNTCSGLQNVSVCDTCPSSHTPHSPPLVLFLSTFPCTSVHTSGVISRTSFYPSMFTAYYCRIAVVTRKDRGWCVRLRTSRPPTCHDITPLLSPLLAWVQSRVPVQQGEGKTDIQRVFMHLCMWGRDE